MKSKISTSTIPLKSNYSDFITGVDYQDTFVVEGSQEKLSIESIYLNIFSHTPIWVEKLFFIRNKIVGTMGLKTNVEKSSSSKDNLKIGEKIGFFRIYDIRKDEIIAGEKDSHLDFVVSFFKDGNRIYTSTLVHYNNLFGRIYMSIIIPFHKMIVKSILRSALKNGRI